MGWANYVALGDSLTAGRDDHGPEGARIGWARRLAGILTARTSVQCALTILALQRDLTLAQQQGRGQIRGGIAVSQAATRLANWSWRAAVS